MQKIWLPEGKYPKVEILLGNGNVGIGTTGPSSLLDIEASVQNTDFEMTNTYGTTGRNRIQMNISDRSWAIENDGNMNIWKVRDNTASADRLAIDYNGNVGIGTTSPSYKLDVRGGTVAGAGAYVNTSSHSSLKENFQDASVLEKISQLRINSWQYKPEFANGDFSRHLYPTTDEFYALFGLGRDKFTISPEDIAGVALKGVQEQQKQIASLSGQLASLSNIIQVEGQCVTGDTLLPIRRKKRRRKSEEISGDGDNGEENSYMAKLLNGLNNHLTMKPFNHDEYDYLLCRIDEVIPGDEVLSLNEAIEALGYAKINKLMDMGVQEVYELTTKSGRKIRTTANHPYLTLLNS